MSKLLEQLSKIGANIGLSGIDLLNWVESKHAQEIELERQQMEAEKQRTEHDIELEKQKREQEVKLEKQRQESEKQKSDQEIELERHRMNLEAEQNTADMVFKRNLELKIQIDLDFKLQEHKFQQEKLATYAEKIKYASSTSNHKGKSNQHTQIRLPAYKENADDLRDWLDRWELVCTMEKLDKKFWATKILEFLQGEPLNLVFSMKLDDRNSYEKIKEALLMRFSLTTEGLRMRFWKSLPEKKQTFLEYSLQLQRLFDRWVKSSNIEQSYASLRELVITSKILESVDKPLYNYIIEQNPTTLDALINLSVNFCEASPSIPFAKPQPSKPENGYA